MQISCLFSFIPSGSLAERCCCCCRLSLILRSPSSACQYSPGEAGIIWAVRLEPDPGSGGQRLLPPGLEPTEVAALPLPEELAEELRLLQELHLALDRALRWPPVLVEHRAAGCVIIQYGAGLGGGRSSSSISFQIPEGVRGSACLHLPVSMAKPEHYTVQDCFSLKSVLP